ncbi:phage major capsid protein [Bosea sp. TAF32]|uniref:phage major capsid protein n=1 Tax=Bosea sp. TAF32 TaxID=3237482 RepID=UPI003F8E87A5
MTLHAPSDLALVAKLMAAGRGSALQAATLAEAMRAPPRVAQLLKAAVPAGNTTDPAYAGLLSSYQAMTATFVESLRPQSVFARLLADGLVPAPLRTSVNSVSVALTGAIVADGAPAPVGRMTLAVGQLTPRQAIALIALTREAAASPAAAALAFVDRELRRAVAATIDAAFLSVVAAGITAIPSSGTDAEAAIADIAALAAAVNVAGAGPLFFAMRSETANAASLLRDTLGGYAFPALGLTGGEIAGVPVLITDALPAGHVMLIDAGGIAADIDQIQIEFSQNASIQLKNDPENAAAALTSMFQTNAVAVRAVAYFGAERFRGSAVAVLHGVAWGGAAS